jgi:hypothetical protein
VGLAAARLPRTTRAACTASLLRCLRPCRRRSCRRRFDGCHQPSGGGLIDAALHAGAGSRPLVSWCPGGRARHRKPRAPQRSARGALPRRRRRPSLLAVGAGDAGGGGFLQLLLARQQLPQDCPLQLVKLRPTRLVRRRELGGRQRRRRGRLGAVQGSTAARIGAAADVGARRRVGRFACDGPSPAAPATPRGLAGAPASCPLDAACGRQAGRRAVGVSACRRRSAAHPLARKSGPAFTGQPAAGAVHRRPTARAPLEGPITPA